MHLNKKLFLTYFPPASETEGERKSERKSERQRTTGANDWSEPRFHLEMGGFESEIIFYWDAWQHSYTTKMSASAFKTYRWSCNKTIIKRPGPIVKIILNQWTRKSLGTSEYNSKRSIHKTRRWPIFLITAEKETSVEILTSKQFNSKYLKSILMAKIYPWILFDPDKEFVFLPCSNI